MFVIGKCYKGTYLSSIQFSSVFHFLPVEESENHNLLLDGEGKDSKRKKGKLTSEQLAQLHLEQVSLFSSITNSLCY